MSKAIDSFETIYNNPFIFAPLFWEFYAGLGPKPKGILLSYLVLPMALHPATRKFLKNAKSTSTLHTMVVDRSRLYGLPDRVTRYRTLTNTSLQHGLNLKALNLGEDLSIVAADRPVADFCPPDSAKAASKLGTILAPFEPATLFRILGLKVL